MSPAANPPPRLDDFAHTSSSRPSSSPDGGDHDHDPSRNSGSFKDYESHSEQSASQRRSHQSSHHPSTSLPSLASFAPFPSDQQLYSPSYGSYTGSPGNPASLDNQVSPHYSPPQYPYELDTHSDWNVNTASRVSSVRRTTDLLYEYPPRQSADHRVGGHFGLEYGEGTSETPRRHSHQDVRASLAGLFRPEGASASSPRPFSSQGLSSSHIRYTSHERPYTLPDPQQPMFRGISNIPSGTQSSTSVASEGYSSAGAAEKGDEGDNGSVGGHSGGQGGSNQGEDTQMGDTEGNDGEKEKKQVPPKKTTMACHFCRKRKLKCDGLRPSCNGCIRRSLMCTYDPVIRRRGPGKANKSKTASKSPQGAESKLPSGSGRRPTSGSRSAIPYYPAQEPPAPSQPQPSSSSTRLAQAPAPSIPYPQLSLPLPRVQPPSQPQQSASQGIYSSSAPATFQLPRLVYPSTISPPFQSLELPPSPPYQTSALPVQVSQPSTSYSYTLPQGSSYQQSSSYQSQSASSFQHQVSYHHQAQAPQYQLAQPQPQPQMQQSQPQYSSLLRTQPPAEYSYRPSSSTYRIPQPQDYSYTTLYGSQGQGSSRMSGRSELYGFDYDGGDGRTGDKRLRSTRGNEEGSRLSPKRPRDDDDESHHPYYPSGNQGHGQGPASGIP